VKLAFVNDGMYKYASGDPSAVGGAERQQWLLARALAVAGWSITVGVRNELKAGGRSVIGGVEFVSIASSHSHILSAWYRFLISERPDYWYWRGANHLLGPTVEIAKLARVRTIFATAFDTDVRPSRALSQRARWWPLYAWGLSRTDKIFVQHRGQLSDLPSQWRSKAFVIPSMADIGARAEPHSERAKYVAWVGMLRQPKRPDLLVEIAQKTFDTRFIVCGAPSEHRTPAGYGERIVSDLRRLPNVDLLGQVAPEQAQQIIAKAAVLLSTSDGEGFPNTFLQAWSSGTPVVSLKIDPDNLIQRIGLGKVAKTVNGAITNIRTLINLIERREEIAARARRYVMTAHSESAVVTAVEAALCGSHGDTSNSCQSSSLV
jgi:glycosyltransferase involved in cell wall biosynthesis